MMVETNKLWLFWNQKRHRQRETKNQVTVAQLSNRLVSNTLDSNWILTSSPPHKVTPKQ